MVVVPGRRIMPRRLLPASTVLIAAAALAVGAAPAAADADIPLGDAISGQYQMPETADAATAAAAPAAAMAGAAAEEAQYHPEIPAGNSEDVSESLPVPPVDSSPVEPPVSPPAEPPVEAPAEPRDDPPADPPAEAPAEPRVEAPAEPRVDLPVERLVETAILARAHAREKAPLVEPDEQPAIEQDDATLMPIDKVEETLELPLAIPDAAPADVVPIEPPAPEVLAPASNINVSIRIFSPGDNGPVTQTTGGGEGGPGAAPGPVTSGAAPGPVTWIWNWTWTGAPGCDAGLGANAAPQIGIPTWTWNWIWVCGEDAGEPPLISELPLPQLPGIGAVPDVAGGLIPAVKLPALVPVPDIGGLAPIDTPVGPAPRADRAAPQPEHAEHGLAAGARAAYAPPATAPAPLMSSAPAVAPEPTSSEPAVDRAPARHRGRDTTGRRGAISAQQSPIEAPLAAAGAAAAAAAAGAGSGPATLVTLLSLLACFLAGALLQIVGLPRLLLRASRLERPG
jgi:hypothetical protein